MNNIVLSSGIIGIDWSQSINLMVRASSKISHSDNFMLKTKCEYDELVLESSDIDSTDKKLKSLFKLYLSEQIKDLKSPVYFLSDPLFLNSGATWQKLNSDKTFAFFFCSPEYYLATMEDATSDDENIDQQECLDNWLEGARKIWDFYVCYPDSTLLINIEDVAKDPLSNASKVFEFVGCELDDNGNDNNQAPNSINTTMANPIEKLSLLLLQNMKLETIKASSELNELYANLAMTSILADSALSYDASERAGIRLSECQKLITMISTRQVQLESDSASFATSNSELIVDNAKLKTEFTSRTSALESSLSELTAENELALLQINQLQEELEATYLNANELKGELTAGASALETSLSECKAENELTSLQIKQLQEELSDSATLAASNSELIVDNAKLKAEFTSRTLALETDLSELKSENELALLQINQLQEELEHYYIQYQKMTYSPKREISYATDLNRVKVSLSLMNMK
jgi:hypothetical protein